MPTPVTTYQEIPPFCSCGEMLGKIQKECERWIAREKKNGATLREAYLSLMDAKGLTKTCCRGLILNNVNKQIKDVTKNAFCSFVSTENGNRQNNIDNNTSHPAFFTVDENGMFYTNNGPLAFDEKAYADKISEVTGVRVTNSFMKLTPTDVKSYPLNMTYIKPLPKYQY